MLSEAQSQIQCQAGAPEGAGGSLREDFARNLLSALISAEAVLTRGKTSQPACFASFASHRAAAQTAIANLRSALQNGQHAYSNHLLDRAADNLLTSLSDIDKNRLALLGDAGLIAQAGGACETDLENEIETWWNLAQTALDFVREAGDDPRASSQTSNRMTVLLTLA